MSLKQNFRFDVGDRTGVFQMFLLERMLRCSQRRWRMSPPGCSRPDRSLSWLGDIAASVHSLVLPVTGVTGEGSGDGG